MSILHAFAGSRPRRSPLRGLALAALMLSTVRGAHADSLGAVQNPLDALASTAAVVEGRVNAHAYTYDRAAGPRTIATLEGVSTAFGRFGDRTLTLATLGGPVSERRWLFIPELPRLTENTRYLVFLTRADWFFSPIVENYVFRIEPGPKGGEVLIAPSGHVVVGLSRDELQLSAEPVVETQIDFLSPFAAERWLDGATDILAAALSKDSFLATLAELQRSVPIAGEFRPTPAADRIWNETRTEAETPVRGADTSAPKSTGNANSTDRRWER